MNSHEKLHQYLLGELTEWKPKEGNPTVSGEGFNNYNVVMLEPNVLPKIYEYDLVYIGNPIVNARGITSGSRGVQRSTQTYMIDIYTKRGGSGNVGRIETLKASNENAKVIADLLSKQGFIISMPQADLNYANTLVARQVMNVTRTFIT